VAVAVSFPKKRDHGTFQAGATSYVEKVNKTTWKGCVRITGGQYNTTLFGHPHLNWVAYQKNVHRRINHLGERHYLEGDMVTIPTFRRGSQCVNIKPRTPITSSSRVMLTVQHSLPNTFHRVANTWMESDANDPTGGSYRFCVSSGETFSSIFKELTLNWLSFDQRESTLQGDTRVQATNVEYVNNQAIDNNIARCRDLSDDSLVIGNRTALVAVDALIPNDRFLMPNSRYAQYATWTETNSTDAKVCHVTSWPGVPILNSYVDLISFAPQGQE